MLNPYLHQDDEGDLWIVTDDGSRGHSAKLLGKPRESLYYSLPEPLWGELAERIAAWRDARRYGRECREEVIHTYNRSRIR